MQKVCIEFVNGDKINLNLYEEYAPLTVANFMHLVDIEFYNATIFHRIIKGFMSQGGGFVINKDNQLVQATPGYTIPGEFGSNGWPNKISHTLGVVSMARTSEANSASSQFFICDENAKFLDGQYAAFGIVADQESLDVARKLNSVTTAKLDNGLADFPACDLKQITIKSISRI